MYIKYYWKFSFDGVWRTTQAEIEFLNWNNQKGFTTYGGLPEVIVRAIGWRSRIRSGSFPTSSVGPSPSGTNTSSMRLRAH